VATENPNIREEQAFNLPGISAWFGLFSKGMLWLLPHWYEKVSRCLFPKKDRMKRKCGVSTPSLFPDLTPLEYASDVL
jgi:hypothetical protein